VNDELLLSDFHIHTRYSDGSLPLRDVVDLFGRSGHDVIAITDHIVERRSLLGKAARLLRRTLTPELAREYFEEIRFEARRAWEAYRMVVIPGAEITRNAFHPNASAHILALGITEYLPAEGSPLQILKEIRRRGAVSVACHPHRMKEWISNTMYLWNRRERLSRYIDRWEVACRWDLFHPVLRARLPGLANGDLHEPSHLYAWKTLVEAPREAGPVLETLRGPARLQRVFLAPEPRPRFAPAPQLALNLRSAAP
jgi:hypothetical protein